MSATFFALTSRTELLIPVRLPPGRARLSTSFAPTGSPTHVKTIGIVEVARLAAAVAVEPHVKMRSGFWRTSSVARLFFASKAPSAQR